MIPLTQVSSDLIHLLEATDHLALFLDRHLKVVTFTPRLRERFASTDTTPNGDDLLDVITQRIGYTALTQDVQTVLNTLTPLQREVQDETGEWYTGRLIPYGHKANEADGVVVTFLELTTLKRAESEIRISAQRQSFIRRLSDALTSCNSAREIESKVCKLLGEYMGADRVFCLRRQSSGGFAPITTEHCRQGLNPAPADAQAALGVDVLTALDTAQCSLFNCEEDALTKQNSRASLKKLGAAAQVAVPWVHKGRTVLALVVQQSERRFWTPSDVELIRDTAERAQLALEHLLRTQAMQAAMRRKDAFLATLAHELRNPLTPIRHGLALLRHGARTEHDIENSLDIMERHLLHLIRLVDDLTDGSRISRGLVKLNKKQVDLTQVVRTALETSHHAAEIEGRQVTVDLDTTPMVVDGDAGRLVQVVSNLLSNALKHTEAQHQISIALHAKNEWARLCVRDNGPGIAPDVLPRVFDLFVQADPSKSSGLGLGLSLVRDLVRLHGGDVEVHSGGIGKGSEFTVWLPLSQHCLAQSEPSESERSAPPAEAMSGRALVVDDNEDAAETLRMLLQLSGIETETAYDGPSALQAFDKFRPDVVYLDIGMPSMDGYEVARRIRQREHGKSVLIVALTGWAQEHERRLTRDSGFDHHLVKPVSLQDVTSVFRGASASQNPPCA